MKYVAYTILALVIFIAVCASCTAISFVIDPAAKAIDNTHDYIVQKVDDATNYETRKQVEDTCRAMMASYTSDKLCYEQYKDSENTEKQSWAEQAMMRANKTAASYNEYILKNSFVWDGNVPEDIKASLEYLKGE